MATFDLAEFIADSFLYQLLQKNVSIDYTFLPLGLHVPPATLMVKYNWMLLSFPVGFDPNSLSDLTLVVLNLTSCHFDGKYHEVEDGKKG